MSQAEPASTSHTTSEASRSRWLLVWVSSFSVVFGLLVGGIIYLVSRPERGEAVRLLPPPSPVPLVVHVLGAVHQPGVYPLAAGSRVQAAIQAAGGLAPNAALENLNLAAPLQDGQQIWVAEQTIPNRSLKPESSVVDQTPPATEPGRGQATGTARSGSLPETSRTTATRPGPININTATAAELESLPGIGPALAQRILEYRQAHGPFANITAIQKVSGIGPGIFKRIQNLITVQG